MNKGQNIEISQPKQSVVYNSVFLCFLSILILLIHYFIVFSAQINNFQLVSESSTLYRKILKILTRDETYSVGLELSALAVFILSRKNIKKSQDGADIPAQIAQVTAVLTLLPLLGYIREFCIWVSENWLSFWSYIMQHRQYVVCFISLTIIAVAGVLLYRGKRKNRKIFILGNTDSFLNNLFLLMVILHVARFLWYYGGMQDFIMSNRNHFVDDIIMLSVFLVSLTGCIAVLIHCKNKNYHFPLIMWTIIGGCLFGMAPVFYNVEKVERLFCEHTKFVTIIVVVLTLILFLWNLNFEQIRKMLKKNSKVLFISAIGFAGGIVFLVVVLDDVIQYVGNGNFSEAMKLALQVFALLAAALVIIILLVVLGKAIRNLNKTNIRNTEIWKNNMKIIKDGQRGFIYGYFAACFLVLCIVLIFFFQWFRMLQEKNNDITQTFSQIISLLVLAIIFSIAIIFAMCQIGVYLVRTLSEVKDLERGKEKQYYGIHGLTAFFTLILSVLSWYVYIKIDFSEETALGVAGDAFRYFAFPVIALLWYAIMYYILTVVLVKQGKEAEDLIKTIKKKVYSVAGDFVDAIFTPFQLFFNFFVVLFKAMMGDEEDVVVDEKEGGEKSGESLGEENCDVEKEK